jgi:hypothetical protein
LRQPKGVVTVSTSFEDRIIRRRILEELSDRHRIENAP